MTTQQATEILTARLKPGTIILEHSFEGWLPKIIVKVQSKKDKESGYWHHSGICYPTRLGFWRVFEAVPMPGRTLRGVVRPRKLENYVEMYLKGEADFLFLIPIRDTNAAFENILYNYVGTPYDLVNLIHNQPWYYLFNLWLGRKKAKATKSMVCHEYTMTVWDVYLGLFPDAHKSQISDIYYHDYFGHHSMGELIDG